MQAEPPKGASARQDPTTTCRLHDYHRPRLMPDWAPTCRQKMWL